MEQLMHFHVRLFQLEGKICLLFLESFDSLKETLGSDLGIHVCLQTAFRKPGACTAQSGSLS